MTTPKLAQQINSSQVGSVDRPYSGSLDPIAKVYEERDQLKQQLTQCQADAAALRDALDSIHKRQPADGIGFAMLCGRYEKIAQQASESTTAGADLLKRLREAEWLVANKTSFSIPEHHVKAELARVIEISKTAQTQKETFESLYIKGQAEIEVLRETNKTLHALMKSAENRGVEKAEQSHRLEKQPHCRPLQEGRRNA